MFCEIIRNFLSFLIGLQIVNFAYICLHNNWNNKMKKKSFLQLASLIVSCLISFLFFKSEPEIHTSGAWQALQFWSQQRAYPQNDIPADKYFEQFSQISKSMKKSNFINTDQWQTIGPHNIGGRTLSLAFNPQNTNTIFAGSASGGIWRSYTGGIGAQAWQIVPTGYPVLGVSSIAISQNDSNTIYIGTGEVYNYHNSYGGVTIRVTRGSYGIGILKSTDYGLTWSKSLDWTRDQQRGVEVIKINPLNPNTIWAGTTEGTYKSINAGLTWQLIDSTIMVTDIKINPEDTSMVWIACGNSGSTGKGIYRTTDNGADWAQLTSGVPTNFNGKILLEIYNASPSTLFASVGMGSDDGAGTYLLKTTNYGDTWTTLSTLDYATYQGWYSHFVGINQNDPTKMLVGGIDLYKSTNGGTNFIQKSYWYLWYLGQAIPPGEPEGPPNYSHADHHCILYNPDNPDIIYFGNDGGVFRTTDGGETFSGCNGGYQTSQFYNYFASSFQDSLIAIGGLQDNATAIYWGTDYWRREIGGDGTSAGIDPLNDNIMYGTYQYMSLQKSTDQGNNWDYIAPPGTNVSFVAPFIVSPSNPQILYAGTDLVYKSTNKGSSWNGTGSNSFNGDPLLTLSIADNDQNFLYAATAPVSHTASVYRTTNGGSNWTNITQNLPNRYPMDIDVNPDDPGTAYIVFSGFGTSHLFKTTDAGDSWVDKGTGLPDVPTSAVVIDPEYTDRVYVGNDLGVFVSLDGGDSWQTFDDGLVDAVIVMDLNISLSNRKLRCVTHGSGVFERSLISGPVPVELVSFTADLVQQGVKLNWETSTETNNHGFEIEKSLDGKNFFMIGFVKGAGTSTIDHLYSFTDKLTSNPNSMLYYRLKQIDFDGKFKYSDIVSINVDSPMEYKLGQNYPNPFNPTTTITFTIKKRNKTTLRIYNSLGQIVDEIFNEFKEPGEYTVTYNASKLSSGIYVYELQSGNFKISKKMVLLK
jgi:Secretion system C-terminal sorting domain